jgi:hypothetical protein
MSDNIIFYSDTIGKEVSTTRSPNSAGTDWGFEHLRPLHKAICADIVKNPDSSNGDEEYGLVFKCRDGKIRTAWIMCDPEGNGAGHLDIVGGDDK